MKVVFVILLLIFFLGIGITLNFILNNIIIPRKISSLITETIESWTGEKPSIEKISFSFIKGLQIKNLTLYSKKIKFSLNFPYINLRFKYLPLILNRKIVFTFFTAPIEEMKIRGKGDYSLKEKILSSHLYIYRVPLPLLHNLSFPLPFEIEKGFSNPEIYLKVSPSKEIEVQANIPVEDLNLNIFQQPIKGSFVGFLDFKKPKDGLVEIREVRIKPEKISFTSPIFKELTLSKGEIIYKNNSLKIDMLNLLYLDSTYKLSGEITNLFLQPKVEGKLEKEHLSLTTRASYLNEKINLEEIILRLPNSKLNLWGKVNDLKRFQTELYFKGFINLQDLEILPIRFPQKIKELNIDSRLDIEGQMRGGAKDLDKIYSLIKIKTGSFKIEKYALEKISLRLKTENGILDGELKGNAYGGEFFMDIKDLYLKKDIPFLLSLNLEEVNLKKLNETSLKIPREISGTLYGELNCRGNLKNLKKIKGEGWFEVHQGFLWQLPILDKLSKVLELPDIEKSIFREVHGNFLIKDESIYTQDLELISEKIVLKTKGSINFNGDLDLKVEIEIPEEKEPSAEWEKLTDIFLKEMRRFVKEIQIKGTLKKPEYKILPPLENILPPLFKK